MSAVSKAQPVEAKERIRSIDFLRGFAILGILIMNIQSFAMPGPAYLNPMSYGDLEGANKWVWILSHLFGDQKFMTIFSILYGAGILMVTRSAESRTNKSAGLHYRRTFWLLVIGLIHAHLIWYGDILVPYALCALIMYFFRKARPKIQFILGACLIAVHTVLYLGIGSSIPHWPEESRADTMESWAPGIQKLQAEIEAYTGTFAQQTKERSESALFLETGVFFMLFFWRAGGLMLVGMALYNWGVLTAQRSIGFYKKGWLISWLLGLPLVIWGILRNFEEGWSLEYSMFIGSQWNYWGSLFISFGMICLVMWVAQTSILGGLQRRLAAVGQMALTNYLTQSLICTFIFYGIGFGLFGQVERVVQVLILVLVWTLQVSWSQPWLRKFYFGPIEWLWRSLTYGKMQKMKREP